MSKDGLIYLDNAATSWPKPHPVIKAMIDFNENVGANPGRSGHRLSMDAARIVFDAREGVASLLNADDPLRVVFARNATEALNTILLGSLLLKDHVVTSGMEHNSVMRPLRALERQGLELSVTRCSDAGYIDPDDIKAAMKKNTRMVVVTHASNVTGAITPVADIAKIAHANDTILCVDASQTAGSIPIHVMRDDIDILVFTGHKSLNGPQGTGGFYIRGGLQKMVSPLEYGGTGSGSEFEEQPEFMPDRFESGTPNTIGIAGLGAGVRFVADRGVDLIRAREIALTGLLTDGIRSIKGVKIYGGTDPAQRIGIVSFTVESMSPSDVSLHLDERFNIMSRPGLHCAPAAHRTIGTFPQGTVRLSLGLFTTEEEINTAIKAIETLSWENRK